MTAMTIQQAIDLAVQHHQAGRLPRPRRSTGKSWPQQPKHPDALHRLGVLAAQAGRPRSGGGFDRPRPSPSIPTSRNITAIWATSCQRARAIWTRPSPATSGPLQLKPDFPEAYYNLGNAWMARKELDQAIACYQRTIALRPDHAGACNNLGNAWREKNEPDQAIACYQRAWPSRPTMPKLTTISALPGWKNQFDQAIACYQRALRSSRTLPRP